MNIVELIFPGIIHAMVAVGGAFLGARLTLSTYDKQEKRRLKIHTLRRFKGRMHSETWADALNEIPVTFNDSAKVKKAFGEAFRSITAKRENKDRLDPSQFAEELRNLVRAMYADLGWPEPREDWEFQNYLTYNPDNH